MKLTINTKSIFEMQDQIYEVDANKIIRVHKWSPVVITGTLRNEKGEIVHDANMVGITTFNYFEEDCFVIDETRFFCTEDTRFSVSGQVYTNDYCALITD